MADRTQSPAYEALRASSRRLLLFIEGEIAPRRRQGYDLRRSVRGGRLDQGCATRPERIARAWPDRREAAYEATRLRAVGSLARYRDGNARDAHQRKCPRAAQFAGDDADATGFGQRVIGGN